MTGQIVSRLVDRRQEAGHYEERFDGSGIPSGVYVYRLNAGGTDLSRKMVYLK